MTGHSSMPDLTDAVSVPPGAMKVPLTSWLGLFAMLVAMVYATADRQIFILFAQAIKLDLGLSDTQLGLLQGVGLTFVGLITVYPLAWIADRADRRKVTAACVAMWSLAVLGCGLSPGFVALLVFSSLVGVGEAGIGPAGFAIMPDLFPRPAWQLANSVFAIGYRLASSLGVYVAGALIVAVEWLRPGLPPALAAMSEWRQCFLLTVVFAPIAIACFLFLPKRAAGVPATTAATSPDVRYESAWRFLLRHKAAWILTLLGASCMNFGGVAIAGWTPVVAQRYFGQTPLDSGTWLASIGLVSGLVGFFGGAPVVEWMRVRYGMKAPTYALSATTALMALCALAMAFATNVPQLYILWGVQATIGMVGSMVVPTIIQNMSPRHLRAQLFAVITFVSMAGAISYVVVGAVSDALSGAAQFPLLLAATSVGFVATLAGSLIVWRSLPYFLALAEEVAASDAPSSA